MKVLLLQDIKGVGRRMEIKNVSDGYARNFLIPKKLAVPANETALKNKTAIDAQEGALLKKYQDLAAKLATEKLEFSVKTGARQEVFSPINKEMIQNALRDKGYGEAEVNLNKPLKTLGEHEVAVNFGRGVRGQLKVILLG